MADSQPTRGTLTVHCGFTPSSIPDEMLAELEQALAGHTLEFAQGPWSNLTSNPPDERQSAADVLFGQPHPEQLIDSRASWIHLTSAGYGRYDTSDLRDLFRSRGVALTTSSSVYAQPCAEHVLAMMLAMARRLPEAVQEQVGPRKWHDHEIRKRSFLLSGQSVLILGYGAIARRLVELLQPFEMKVTVVRQRPTGAEPVATISEAALEPALRDTQHVVNTLPDHPTTHRFLNAERLALLPLEAIVYNVGRGSTIDQEALRDALESARLGGAYLDVTEPEPLPPDHPLWSAPRCYITPHTAGGHRGELADLIRHFVANFRRFVKGQTLIDRVM
jgi:phosphoglycerate dehydrogenase-like enzyme